MWNINKHSQSLTVTPVSGDNGYLFGFFPKLPESEGHTKLACTVSD